VQARRPAARDYSAPAGRGSAKRVNASARFDSAHFALSTAFYGYRRVTATLMRQGMVVNANNSAAYARGQSLAQRGRFPEDTAVAFGFLIVPIWCRASFPSSPDQIGGGGGFWLPTSPNVAFSQSLRLSLLSFSMPFSRTAVGWLWSRLVLRLPWLRLDKALEARKPQSAA